MREKILALLGQENPRQPWTDEELAQQLGILREEVTNFRKAEQIADSRERRKPALLAAMRELLAENPGISDRALSAALEDDGFQIKKFAAARYRQELEGQMELEGPASLEGQTAPPVRMYQDSEVFAELIGADGSMKGQIAKAQAAILYPPMGLHCLLYGPSGVGKSYLAELMYCFACQTENFGEGTPYFEFNCADYADNPQLLLAQLFGYNKGAFTGASESKKGIVELCNGGILFLDEVHRLPPEGQEILFYLMDKGKFRRMGEVEVQRESRILVIAATTEDPEESLLLTFRRRIPMMIEIPSMKERPLGEHMEFVRRFFQREAVRLGRRIRIQAEVLPCFLGGAYPGNVGQLKADIQVCCAKAFLESRRLNRSTITVTVNSLTELQKRELESARYSSEIRAMSEHDLYLSSDDSPVSKLDFVNEWNIYEELEEKYARMRQQGMEATEIEDSLTKEIESQLLYHIDEIQKNGFSKEEIGNIVGEKLLAVAEDIYVLAKERLPELDESIVFPLAIHLKAAMGRISHKSGPTSPDLTYIKTQFQTEYRVASDIMREIRTKHYVAFPDKEVGFIAMYLNRFGKTEAKDQKVAILVISHGAVAEGMAEVANSVMGVSHAQGLNLNLWDTPEQMTEKVLEKARRVDMGRGILAMVDMGSLETIGQKIEERLKIPSMTITRTNTMLVIEAVRKAMWTEESLSEICKDLNQFRTSVLTEPGARRKKARKKALLCLCITGEGAAMQMKEQLKQKLNPYLSEISIITRGYIEYAHAERIIESVEQDYEILAIVGTIDPGTDRYPFISSTKLLQGDGISQIRRRIKQVLLRENSRLGEILKPDQVWIDPPMDYKDQVLDAAVRKLEENGAVSPEFHLSLYKREGLMTTVLKYGIAIPHGDPNFVTKPAICITKLDKPVVWDGMNAVDLIFTLALTENSKIYIEQLYQFLSDESVVNALKACRSADEIIRILTKNTKTDI